jgi:hypothetical protein
MKTVGTIGLAALAVLSFACRRAPQESSAKEESSPLILTAQIPPPGVHGRFDHFSFDPSEPGRIFISALGNNSVEVINTVEGSRHHLVLQSAERAAAPLVRRPGIHEARPRRRQRAGRVSWPRSAHHRPRPPTVAGSGCRGRPDPAARRRAQAGGKKTPEVIEAIEILLEHDTAGDPITGIRWTHKTPAGIAEQPCLKAVRFPFGSRASWKAARFKRTCWFKARLFGLQPGAWL